VSKCGCKFSDPPEGHKLCNACYDMLFNKKEEKPMEPAYTPREEYQCDGSTTHYQGCKCHEARRSAELDSLRTENAHLRTLISAGAQNAGGVDPVLAEMDSLRARVKELEEAAKGVLGWWDMKEKKTVGPRDYETHDYELLRAALKGKASLTNTT